MGEKKVAVHGRIHCWSCYAKFLYSRLGRMPSEEELQAHLVESDLAYGLSRYDEKVVANCATCA